MTCAVPHCEQDAISRLGYCRGHSRMPYHVGLVLQYRVEGGTIVRRAVAEVDSKRGMFRLEGDQGWHYPGEIVACSDSP
jgi:hypothetical protein